MRHLLLIALLLLPSGAFAQRSSREPAPACVASCEETCKSEVQASACNPAVGLTVCRLRQDQCVAACTRNCPRR